MIMIWSAVVVFALLGVIFILRRRDLARAQSLVAGGNLAPGCVVAEGIILLLMALAVAIAQQFGAFR
jgi:hypothetical protein